MSHDNSIIKTAARYASQPAMPQGQAGGMQMGGFGGMNNTNRFSGLFGMGMGANLGSAAQAGQRNPNPLTQVKAPQQGLATAGGIQQAMQKGANLKTAAHPDWLLALVPYLKHSTKLAEVSTGGASAPSASTSSLGGGGKSAPSAMPGKQMGTPQGALGSQNQQGQQGAGGGSGLSGAMQGQLGASGGGIGAYGVVRPGWASLRPSPGGIAGVTSGVGGSLKQAMMSGAPAPTPGLTANQPVPPQGGAAAPPPMPGGAPMPPPNGGAPIAGVGGQPSVDPATGQPIVDQAAGGGAPPVDPATGQPMPPPPQTQVDPMTGMPSTSPMQDPPPLPLPMNPRMAPPRPAQASDHANQNMMGGLMNDKAQADNPIGMGEAQDDMKSQAMAMGSKTASYLTRYLNPKTTFGNGPADPISDAKAYGLRVAQEIGEKAGSVKEAKWLAPWLIGAAEMTGVGANMAGMQNDDMQAKRPVPQQRAPMSPSGAPPKPPVPVVSKPAAAPKMPMRRPGAPGRAFLPMLAVGTGLGALGMGKMGSIWMDPAMPDMGQHGVNSPSRSIHDGPPSFMGGKSAPSAASTANTATYTGPTPTPASTSGQATTRTWHGPRPKAPGPGMMGRVMGKMPGGRAGLLMGGAGLLGGMGLSKLLQKKGSVDGIPGDNIIGNPMVNGFPKPAGPRRPVPKAGKMQPITPQGNGTMMKTCSYDECTPFARGFFEACDEKGYDLHYAVEKVGSDFGEEAHQELRDGLEKVSRALVSRLKTRGGMLGLGGVLGTGGAYAAGVGRSTDGRKMPEDYGNQALFLGGTKPPMRNSPAERAWPADMMQNNADQLPVKQGGDGMEKIARLPKPLVEWGGRQLGKGIEFGKGMFGKPMEHATYGAVRPGSANIARGWGFKNYASGMRASENLGNAARYSGGLARPVGVTAFGGIGGGMAGDDLGLGGGHTDVLGMKLNTRGMYLGAGAANPFLRRQFAQRGYARGAGDVGGAMIRRSAWGSMGGSAADQTLYAAGLDKGVQEMGPDGKPMIDPETGQPVMKASNRFGRIGAYAGLGAGALQRGGYRLSRALPKDNWLRPAAHYAGTFGHSTGRKLNSFAHGTFDPLMGGAKAVVRKPLEWAGMQPGSWLGRNLAKSTVAPNASRIAGRVVGGAGLGVGALGMGSNWIDNKIRNSIREGGAELLAEGMPEVGNYMDQYMDERGMLDPNGQFDPTQALNRRGGPGGMFMGGADGIFKSMGMDPSKLSPLQKVMILGGATAGAGGLLAGAPVMAGMGGASAAAGLLPMLMPGQSQQQFGTGPAAPYRPGQPQQQGVGPGGTPYPTQPGARDEWQTQQQFQGQ